MSNNRKEQLEFYSRMFAALSNPNRLQIFLNLIHCCCNRCEVDPINSDITCVGDLGQDIDIAPSTLSHHLKELRNAGLISMIRNGQKIECHVEKRVIEDLASFFLQTPALREMVLGKKRK